MKGNQTPQQDHLRTSDLVNRRSKESHSKKAARKSLNTAFKSVSEDMREPPDFSPISDSSNSIFGGEIANSFAVASNPSSESFHLSNLTLSRTITDHKIYSSDASKIGSLEEYAVMNLLRKAIHKRSMRLLDSLTKTAVEEEKDCFTEVVMKTRIILMCILVWILALWLITFFSSRCGHSLAGPLPT